MSEHVASVESRREMGSEVLRYRRDGGAIEYRKGWRGDRVSKHVASVESLREMGRSVLRYRREVGCCGPRRTLWPI